MSSALPTAFRVSKDLQAQAKPRPWPWYAAPSKTQGYEVQGFAPTSRAARQLREAGIEAGTLQGFLARSAPSDAAPERKHFYFVDESSLASTNQMREFPGPAWPQ